jgi:hypothetical protein
MTSLLSRVRRSVVVDTVATPEHGDPDGDGGGDSYCGGQGNPRV